MNKSVLAKFAGVFVSLLVIWKINDIFLIDPCIEQGGKFQYEKGKCLLENGSIYSTGFEVPLVFLYVVVGFGVSYIVSKGLQNLFNKIGNKIGNKTDNKSN